MIFVPFAEPKKSLVFIYSGHLVRRSRFWKNFMKWLAENQIKLQSEI